MIEEKEIPHVTVTCAVCGEEPKEGLVAFRNDGKGIQFLYTHKECRQALEDSLEAKR